MEHDCKKCLLLEAGEKKAFESIKAYLENIDASDKCDDDEYRRRLELCKSCDNLISGMCLKCGCYVEIRAALNNKSCADFDKKLW